MGLAQGTRLESPPAWTSKIFISEINLISLSWSCLAPPCRVKPPLRKISTYALYYIDVQIVKIRTIELEYKWDEKHCLTIAHHNDKAGARTERIKDLKQTSQIIILLATVLSLLFLES